MTEPDYIDLSPLGRLRFPNHLVPKVILFYHDGESQDVFVGSLVPFAFSNIWHATPQDPLSSSFSLFSERVYHWQADLRLIANILISSY
ncbi:hypothetical protein HAX54_043495 [Datura stramonium]|uniref:Uncharacterized protein n=1 Tax=Datura stramonium TaxID=4076 RepID=A0ABS8SN63_DATST|nr:hypothetical protein [Datura stramonium]